MGMCVSMWRVANHAMYVTHSSTDLQGFTEFRYSGECIPGDL